MQQIDKMFVITTIKVDCNLIQGYNTVAYSRIVEKYFLESFNLIITGRQAGSLSNKNSWTAPQYFGPN